MKKKLAIIAILLVTVFSLCACTQEIFEAVMGVVMEAMGYGKEALEIESIDTEATINAFEEAGLYTKELDVECVTAEDLSEIGIEGVDVPLAMQVAFPDFSDFSPEDEIDIEFLTKVKAAAIMEYESAEQAESVTHAVVEVIKNATSTDIVELIGDESYSDLVEMLMFLRDYINVQAVGNTVVIYTTPAADLFVEGIAE